MAWMNEAANVAPPTLSNLNQGTLPAAASDAAAVTVVGNGFLSLQVDADAFVVFGTAVDAAPTDVTSSNGYPLQADKQVDYRLPKNVTKMWIQSADAAGNYYWWQ